MTSHFLNLFSALRAAGRTNERGSGLLLIQEYSFKWKESPRKDSRKDSRKRARNSQQEVPQGFFACNSIGQKLLWDFPDRLRESLLEALRENPSQLERIFLY